MLKIKLSYSIGGIPEAIENNKTGFLIVPYLEEELVKKIIFLYKNIKVLNNLGSNGKKRVKQRFNSLKKDDRLIKLFKDILEH